MQITGRVRDAAGRPLGGASLTALGAAHETIASARTDQTGRFSLQGEGIVMLEAIGPDWEGPPAAVTSLPRLWRVPGTPRPPQAEVELTLRACLPVAVRAFASVPVRPGDSVAHGALLTEPSAEGQRQLNQCWLRDRQDKVAPGAFRWEPGEGGPWLFLPPGQLTQLQVLWGAFGGEVPFGAVVCHASNAGQSLVVAAEAGREPQDPGVGSLAGIQSGPDGVYELWLNEDLAASACARLETAYANALAEGYRPGSEVDDLRAAALAQLAAMHAVAVPARAAALERRAERAAYADAALSGALWALEKLVLARAEQEIMRHRELPRSVRLRQADGGPAAGADVSYRQAAHAFRFGIFVDPSTHPISREPLDGQLWAAIKALGINQITLIYLWSHLEPVRGERHDAEVDAALPRAQLAHAGYRLKGHISLWPWHGAYPEQWTAFTPGWLYKLDVAGVQAAAYEHQRALAAYCHDYVAGFQAINEPMLSHTNAINFTLPQTLDLVRRSSAALRAGGCMGPIEVNNCCVFAESVNADVREQGYERMPCEFFEDLAAAAVDFDEVGIQLYYGGYMMSSLFQGGFAIRQLADLSDLIDRYAHLGKPVNVAEVSVPSSAPPPDGPYVGEWHGPWTPERQAEWVRALYTLCYSKQPVREVTWWNATDEHAFIRSGGLLTEDYQPKPAYHVLHELIEGWRATGEAKAGEQGEVQFSGPAGSYELTVTCEGVTSGPYRLDLGWESGPATEVVLAEGH